MEIKETDKQVKRHHKDTILQPLECGKFYRTNDPFLQQINDIKIKGELFYKDTYRHINQTQCVDLVWILISTSQM